MKIFSSFLCSSILFSLLACNKNSDPVATLTKTDLISASAWNYENAGIDNDRNGTIDVPLSSLAPSLVQTCKTDNLLTYKKDNTGITDEGATKCNSTDPQTSAFNWSFADNEININISNSIFSLVNGKSKVVTLTSTNFSLSRDTILLGTPYSMVVNLKH
jgi:hypothetical protein